MMKHTISEKALTIFNEKPKRYNCAQAVAAAFERKDLIKLLESCGGGRAPGGLCGALYAAALIAGEEKSESVKEQFQNTLGQQECKLLKKAGVKCSDCVCCAAELAEREG